MKRLFVLLFLAMLFSASWAGKRALLVGISKYNPTKMDEWINLHGAADVAMIQPELEKQGFVVTTITDSKATHDGIIAGLNTLAKSCKKGDIVYLHFSTHGQLVEDGLNGKKKDEADGWDESIAPYDSKMVISERYDGSKHITDDELNVYFKKIRTAIGPKGVLYVALDACHAGNAEKGAETTVRGTNVVLTKTGKKVNNQKLDSLSHEHYQVEVSPKMGQMLMLEACSSAEDNHEVRYQGKERGSLSTMIYLALQKVSLGNQPKLVEQAVKFQVEKSGIWPKKQHLVTETSY